MRFRWAHLCFNYALIFERLNRSVSICYSFEGFDIFALLNKTSADVIELYDLKDILPRRQGVQKFSTSKLNHRPS